MDRHAIWKCVLLMSTKWMYIWLILCIRVWSVHVDRSAVDVLRPKSNSNINSAGRRLLFYQRTWWRPQIETFSALLALCERNPPGNGGFRSQQLVVRRFHVFFDLRLYKCLSKQSICRWFETPSRSLWRHCNEVRYYENSFRKLAKSSKQYQIHCTWCTAHAKAVLTSMLILQHTRGASETTILVRYDRLSPPSLNNALSSTHVFIISSWCIYVINLLIYFRVIS